MQLSKIQLSEMQLVEVVIYTLARGKLSFAAECRIQELLNMRELSDLEILAMDQLLKAITQGRVQSLS